MTLKKKETELLISAYAKVVLDGCRKIQPDLPSQFSRLTMKDTRFLQSIQGLGEITHRYKDNEALDKALDSIDLGLIYQGVEEREQSAAREGRTGLAYEDFIVLQLLQYFKKDFFTWFDKPECTSCDNGLASVRFKDVSLPPSPNPHDIGRIENYICDECAKTYTFPRYNDPVKLLETKKGRCGEWVNCFMLLLQALLGTKGQVRYVWNLEDHVWCEYYSKAKDEWIHLDPCEGVYNEPSLYLDNWGKKMSWCIAFGDAYVMDVSNKYVTNKEKKIKKSTTVTNVHAIYKLLNEMNKKKLLKYYALEFESQDIPEEARLMQFYFEVLLIMNKEIELLKTAQKKSPMESSSLVKGRQTGSAEWTKVRGEDGS